MSLLDGDELRLVAVLRINCWNDKVLYRLESRFA